MCGKVSDHFTKLALIGFIGLGFVLHAPAQNAANPPEANEPRAALEDVVIHVNQVAYDEGAPKFAVVETARPMPEGSRFYVRQPESDIVFPGTLARMQECEEW